MAVPKQRKTKSKRDQRRMHIFLASPFLATCPKCGKATKPHTMCHNCGYYKGKEVVNVMKKLEKKERKAREKEMKETEKDQPKKEKPMSLEELSKKKF